MARRAIEALVEVAQEDAGSGEELFEELTRAARRLAESRPSFAAIVGALGRLLAPARAWTQLEPTELRRLIMDEASGLLNARDRAPAAIAIQLRERLEDALVLTHSASSTVKEALLRTPPERVVCTVSSPFEEGRELAEELRENGIDAEVIEDVEGEAYLEQASLVLVGADTVFLDGSLLNKVGTRAIAETAAAHRIPVVVACEVIKVAPVEPKTVPGDGVTDLTPPTLIEHYVTEEGAYVPEEIRALADRTPFLRDGYALLRGS